MTNPLELADRMEAGKDVKSEEFMVAVKAVDNWMPDESGLEDLSVLKWTVGEADFSSFWSHTNLQDLLDLFPHVLPGWEWACDSMANAFLYKPGKRPDHNPMDVMGWAKNSPATAFAIAFLRAVGEKE